MSDLTQTNQAVTQGATPPRGNRLSSKKQGEPGLVQIFPREADAAPATWKITHRDVAGRSSECPWRLEDTKVSRKHLVLEPAPEGFLVSDLGSRNGTYIDGVPLGSGSQALVHFGSVLRVANTLLLAVPTVQSYATPPRAFSAASGVSKAVVAGPTLSAVWDEAARIAGEPHPVLVVGENGSGKEVLAQIIHAVGHPDKPLVARNVGAIPEGLFESELFGHARGSFTTAVQSRLGAFRSANHGVLFLDEIADLRLDHQVKLLRALDDGLIMPVGEDRPIKVNTRVVAATNKDLRQLVIEGRFREDLFFRLATVTLRVPPLRERKDEIILLALRMLGAQSGGFRMSTDTAEVLALAPWPGNVRNLLRVMLEACRQATKENRSIIEPSDLPDLEPLGSDDSENRPVLTTEKLRTAVLRSHGVIKRAALSLGISRSSFYEECKRLGIDPRELRKRS
ncbi:MAG TPA: sigma 54-interacting transcriptional regulator [Polyangiaceae bacterium]|jgi:DNA-binding NtrC family response regulator|nr:MAG: Transcriptional regulatory protein QseF [Deltaproteobacteria bacterium ADurb.Bin207]HNT00211.1 sigma 54-interacting transcriptional regulator [Polyangiaceae bacterium]HNZ24329.1 sigma 54-interacting transcriptional regulator [Polyangiaceae bacterium]HOD25114.1 sigma 54-interacting transcriptional regulator [Polyangiaceae bacterium]HOE49638.1 sigma 54-interacting transcriptional regulator [Polyangiaceae bacterium]